MIKGSYDDLVKIAKNNVCSEHKTPLELAWYSPEKTYVLRCDQGTHIEPAHHVPGGVYSEDSVLPGHYPDAVVRSMSLTAEYKAGKQEQSVPGRTLIPTQDLGTGSLLTPEQVQELIDYAYKYHLDPYRGHVVLMYGKPYIGIDGYLYHAGQEKIPYSLNSRPMTTEERKQYKIGKDDHAWIARVDLIETGQVFTGTGIVTSDEMTAMSDKKPDQFRSPVVAAKPWQMAQKRAEWQALRRAFPIGESELPT